MTQKVQSISIAGAGLVGSLMAIYLAKRGYNVTLFEKRDDMRGSDQSGGRSINLALSNRGWLPLEEVGLAKQVQKMIIPMRGRMMHDEQGALTFQPYGKANQAINSISRGGLNALLMDEAEKNGVTIQFDTSCTGVDFAETTLNFDHGDRKSIVKSDLIIGADGAFSSIRGAMQKTDRFNYSQFYIEHGYKELTIPPGKDGSFRIEKHALHIWPRGNFMLIALPNLDGSFTCTLFFPFEGNPSFDTLKTDKEVTSFFTRTFPDALELLPTLTDDFQHNPTSSLVTVKSFPWVNHRTLLIGDASHAIVPFYGQGMNSGFEDCRILNQMLDEHQDDWDKVLPLFQTMRKPDADAISDLALQNFIEMRDHVGDRDFLLRKKIEARIHELFPDTWIPLYSMVTFNEHIRYSEALNKGKIQKEIMDDVMAISDIHKKWETLDLHQLITRLKAKIAG